MVHAMTYGVQSVPKLLVQGVTSALHSTQK
jgi:hypothetical protein